MTVMALPASTPEVLTVIGKAEFAVLLLPSCPDKLLPQVIARPGDGSAAALGAINTPTATATPTSMATGVLTTMTANPSAGDGRPAADSSLINTARP
jgi:hypothetical protein